MFKKLFIGIMCLCLLSAVGCKKDAERLSVDNVDTTVSTPEKVEEKPVYYTNPLTGIGNLDKETAGRRPVAVTINNISIAQKVQTGVGMADIVYETEVEGGITRLIAVFQDITKVEKLGTVRSARYDFVDLAMGHNAIYVHHGQDEYHAGPHLRKMDHFTVDTNAGGGRESNGLAREHTLYAYGDKLWEILSDGRFEAQNTSSNPWVNFAGGDEEIKLENIANSVNVTFSNSYKTSFVYDAATGKYDRYFNGTKRLDYVTGESVSFKNVFVLTTKIYTYPNCTDGKNHKKVELTSGDGYYMVNGTYTPIKWSKGASSNGFEFTLADGSPLTVNTGNSWVCIAGNTNPAPVFG